MGGNGIYVKASDILSATEGMVAAAELTKAMLEAINGIELESDEANRRVLIDNAINCAQAVEALCSYIRTLQEVRP
jgi:hypothetical protein